MDSPVFASTARPNNGAASASTILVLVLGSLTALGPLAIDMYLPALPNIAEQLGVNMGRIELTLTAFLCGVACGQAFYGPIVDKWGRRWPLLIGMVLFVIASIGCAYAQSFGSLFFWRVLMALGGSASMVIPRAVVRDLFDEKESLRVYALLTLILGVSPILAPTLGGFMLEHTGWRGIFWILAGVGLLCTLAIVKWLPESFPAAIRTPVSVGKAFITYGKLLADRRFLGPAIASGFTLGAIFAYLQGSSSVFIQFFGLTPKQYAIVFGFNAIGLIAASQINRWLLDRFTSWQVVSTAFLFNAVVGLTMAVAGATGWGGLPAIIALLFLSLSAAGVIFPNVAAMAMTPFGAVAGSASALLGTLQFAIGGVAGAVVSFLPKGSPLPMCAGVAGCALAGWITLRTLARR